MLVSDLSYSDYLGRLAIGRVFNGSARSNDQLVCIGENGRLAPLKVSGFRATRAWSWRRRTKSRRGTSWSCPESRRSRSEIPSATSEHPKAMKRLTVDEPTVAMRFAINDSPLSGVKANGWQSSKILERLIRETRLNVGIKLEANGDKESFWSKAAASSRWPFSSKP